MYTFPALSFLRPALAACVLVALGSPPALADKTTDIDLRIGVAITETIEPGDSMACPMIGRLSGHGYSTELGPVSVEATDCFVPTDATGTSFKFFTKPETVVKLTTRNGDQVFGSYENGLAKGAPFPIMSISANLKISGGTGLYRKASGSATIEGIENIGVVPAVGVLVISGKLSY